MGPLNGLRIIEIGSIGPGPFAGMIFADLGAEVIRIDRPGHDPYPELLHRGRRSVVLDLKRPEAVEIVLRLVESVDGFMEGFRPGVIERLGLGPEACLERNPNLVYGRMTGWGQSGPLAKTAGHDIGYIAVAGALHPIGPPGGAPVPPLNLVGDFGGGGMLLAVGMLSALLHVQAGGRGQVVDAAMVDGAALLTTFLHSMRHAGLWTDERGANLLDGGAPFYTTYETADGRRLAVGPLEPKFYAAFVEGLGIEPADLPDQYDRSRWPELRQRFAAVLFTKTQDEWMQIFAGTDACVAPVQTLSDAASHPHLRSRRTFVEVDGVEQPGPAPRFDRTPASAGSVPERGRDTDSVLAELGFDGDDIASLRQAGIAG